MAEPPDAAHIQELHTHNLTTWEPQRALDERLKLLVYGENRVTLPDTNARGRNRRIEAERMHTGEAARIVSLIKPLYIQSAVPGVQFTGEGQRGMKLQDDIEVGLKEAMERLNPPTDSPRSHGLEQMVVLGRKAELILPTSQYYHDFPFKRPNETEDAWAKRFRDWERKTPLPIMWLNLPAESTFPPSIGATDYEVLSTMQISWAELQRIFSPQEIGDAIPEKPEEIYSEVTLGIYSNRIHLVYILFDRTDGFGLGNVRVGQKKTTHILRTLEHKMGRVAIRILPGMTTNRKQPGYYWRSVLYYVRDMLEEAEALAAYARTGAKFGSFPNYKAWLHRKEDGEGAESVVDRHFDGAMFVLNPGTDQEAREDIEPLHEPRFGENNIALLQFLLGRMGNITGASEALQGVFGPSGEPAWSRNFSAELARGQLRELTDGISAGDLDSFEGITRAIVAHGDTITLARFMDNKRDDIVLKPADVEKFEPVLKVAAEPKIPINRRADLSAGIGLMSEIRQSGLPISMSWMMTTVLGIEQPFHMFEEAIEWEFALSDVGKKFYFDQRIKELEMDLAEDEGMTIDELLASEDLPDDVKQRLLQRAMQAQGAGGGGANGSAALAGANRAATPFSTQGTGPQPAEEAPA